MQKQRWWRTAVLMAALMRASAVVAVAQTSAETPSAEKPSGETQTNKGNAVTQWNEVALAVLPVDPGLLKDSRAFAIVHASIHDAVNAIERRYRPYTSDLSSPAASVDAAIAAAARDALVAVSPTQQAKIDEAYAAALKEIPGGPAKDAGIALGQQSARANLERRADDGLASVEKPVYAPTGAPGDYDFTPPFDQPPLGPLALFPGWGRLTPFGIDIEKHKLDGPLPLKSFRYAWDFQFVKTIGKKESPHRTAEQTEIAFFWFEFSPIGWNRIANTVVRQKKADVWDSARILALVNFALADGYIAGFDAKYHFRFWRPYTAIRRAADDDNRFTEPDTTWEPLFSTETFFIPPVPDYPSTHTVLGAAAAEVLIQVFDDDVAFEATSGTLPGVTRRYHSFTQAAIENGLSRVYGGIHFLHAVLDGYQQGKGIGRAISTLLPPVDGKKMTAER